MDIKNRLRDRFLVGDPDFELVYEAAAELTRLRAEVERLTKQCAAQQEAVEHLVDCLDRIADHAPGTPGLHYESEQQLLNSAVGIADIALEILRDKDRYPSLQALDLPERARAALAAGGNGE